MSFQFANRVARFQGSAVREMFHWATLPGMISLSAGSPAPELFPVESLRKAVNQVLDQEPVGALQYGITEGYEPLREWIAEHLKSKGFDVTLDEVLITTGSLGTGYRFWSSSQWLLVGACCNLSSR